MMDTAQIPDEVRRFILVSIPSVPYLEAMLLLRETQTKAWGAKAVAQRLYTSENVAVELLEQLHAAGVASMTGVDGGHPLYRYQPQTEDLQQMIDCLAQAYAKHLVAVTHLIHSKTEKKARAFADAFLWRKDT